MANKWKRNVSSYLSTCCAAGGHMNYFPLSKMYHHIRGAEKTACTRKLIMVEELHEAQTLYFVLISLRSQLATLLTACTGVFKKPERCLRLLSPSALALLARSKRNNSQQKKTKNKINFYGQSTAERNSSFLNCSKNFHNASLLDTRLNHNQTN